MTGCPRSRLRARYGSSCCAPPGAACRGSWLSSRLSLPAPQGNLASKRKVRVQDPCPVKPGLALVYVEYLLTHPKNRECLLSVPQKKLNCLLKALEASKVIL